MAEGKAKDLQFTPDGVNIAVKQEGALDVQPTISVSTTRDTSRRGSVEIAGITGQFENVQIGDDSSVLFRKVSDEDEARPPASVVTKENLHFIINSPQGVVQIGKCCILLRVNFSNSLVSRLLDEGDVSVKLQSSDTLLELHWSNWEEKKEGIRSKIKVEIRTLLEQSRDSFEHDVISQLLNSSNNYMQLRTLVNLLYDMFGAMLHRITGGCIELWITHVTMEQYEEMKKNKYDLESKLTHFLSKEPNDYTLCIRFQDDVSDSQRPTLGSATNKSNTELKQQFSEAQEKLTSKTSECMGLNLKIEDLQQRLEIAEQQLSNQNEKSKQAQQALTQLQQERDEFAVQISSLTDEREQMVSRQLELETTITELQRKLEAAHKTKEWQHKVVEESPTRDDTRLSSADERTIEKPRRCITNLSTEKLETITIKSTDDEMNCFITGMAVTNTGTILLADYGNKKIKSVSSDNKVLSVLSLPEEPLAITVLDTTTAVVAAGNQKLYIVNISDNNTLSLRSKTKLEYHIEAMVSYNGNIVATCLTKRWTVKQITIKGEVLWSVDVDNSGRQLFTLPYGITITTIKGRAVVVVCDDGKKTLTVLEAETGRYIRTIDLGEEKLPRGITVDNDGNVYVCYRNTSEIVVWSNDFKESKILVSRDKLEERPCFIVYSAVDDSLYVSYAGRSDSGNTVDRFRLV